VALTEQQKAHRALKSMQGSLKGWLRFRERVDRYIAGQKQSAPLLPTTKPLPPRVMAATLRKERYSYEQDLAELLYQLLVECGFNPSSLPRPDVAKDPDAAVKLAKIAMAGKSPTEVASPQAQGFIWLVAIPVAGAALVLSQHIKSKADIAKEKARLECIKSGECTDSGFWLKVGSIAVIAWLAWDKMGLKEAVNKRKARK